MYRKLEIGDIVTGKDRSYVRSIYKVLDTPIVEDYPHSMILVEIVSYDGTVFIEPLLPHMVRRANDFRLASEEEIEESKNPKKENKFRYSKEGGL
jgi:hypothetical protein